MSTIISLIGGGFGVSLVPASVQKLELNGVVYRPLQGQTPTVAMVVSWRRDDASPVLAAFLDVVRRLRSG